ncbi:hypothetical protein [Rubricoccus marinus]|uniref:PhoU domain-containing protein n=1 Tax=Rubricoccus marinus TaxID=716817 RepID=A0A259U2Q2_9BACT|nr:hypothetical protein [Rubricoccus marinus]OZC04279.1 hypothetical protein BSZ36_15590 [Rubricoccus marinus]
MRDHTHPAVALHALALVAAARTALAAARSITERRAGSDPTTLEAPEAAREDLTVLAGEIGSHVARLRLRSIIVGEELSRAASLAQAFEDRLLLDDLARDARRAHQKLLSLHAEMPLATIEEARIVAQSATRLATEPDALPASGDAPASPEWLDLAERAADWLDALREAL